MKNLNEFNAFALLQTVVGLLFSYLGAGGGLAWLSERYLGTPRWLSLIVVVLFFVLAMRRIYNFAKPLSNGK